MSKKGVIFTLVKGKQVYTHAVLHRCKKKRHFRVFSAFVCGSLDDCSPTQSYAHHIFKFRGNDAVLFAFVKARLGLFLHRCRM